MRIRNKKVERLVEKYREISLLGKVSAVLGWDLNVNLPPKGSEGRAAQTAYLTALIADKWLDKEFRKLLEDVNKTKSKLNLEEEAIVRNLNYRGKLYFKVPKKTIVEQSEVTSKAFMVWKEAKKNDKFKDFEPHLKKIVKLNQIIAEHLGYKDNKYDALLDLYEPGLTVKFCKKIFGKLQPELTKTLKKVQKSKNYDRVGDLVDGRLSYPEQDQKRIAFFALRRMGYDLDAGRMDVSPHPFTETLGRQDVRLTTRYHENDFRESFTASMHEAGHGVYEQGVKDEYDLTPLEGGVSLGIHESQSRFWENQLGRSYEFIKFITPIFHAFYAEQLSKVSTNTLYALFNQVKPSLIRVEADEVTYNLHIILRFELENDLINYKLLVKDLPEVWRAKMKRYLGIVPETDREGVLQDVHWSYGAMGYFPTYTLGNLYAAQITATMRKELDLEDLAERGELGTILTWLRSNIHQYGSLYWPDELIKKVTGKGLDPNYFLRYINKKYSKIYQLK